MKRIVVSLALLVAGLTVATTATAQIITPGQQPFASEPTEADGQILEELKTAVSTLRLLPLNPREICHLWERYAASYVLGKRVGRIPELAKTLGTSAEEIKTLQTDSARDLTKILTNILRHRYDYPLPLPACRYWTSLGYSTIFHYELGLENPWQVGDILLRAKREYRFPPDQEGRIESEKQVLYYIETYIREEGGLKYRTAWLKDNDYFAAQTLKEWITVYQFAPSVLGLTAEQTAKLFEAYGKK